MASVDLQPHGLTYRIISDKRASQPPMMLNSLAASANVRQASDAQKEVHISHHFANQAVSI